MKVHNDTTRLFSKRWDTFAVMSLRWPFCMGQKWLTFTWPWCGRLRDIPSNSRVLNTYSFLGWIFRLKNHKQEIYQDNYYMYNKLWIYKDREIIERVHRQNSLRGLSNIYQDMRNPFCHCLPGVHHPQSVHCILLKSRASCHPQHHLSGFQTYHTPCLVFQLKTCISAHNV